MFYAGIGSRQTPRDVLGFMTRLASRIQRSNFVLRSGGALGADMAFAHGAGESVEIFTARDFIPDWAFDTVDQFHPAPHRLNPYVRKLHARNAMIISGADGRTPVRFVLCWTPNASGSGGTGQGIRYARSLGIPIHDLADERERANAESFLARSP